MSIGHYILPGLTLLSVLSLAGCQTAPSAGDTEPPRQDSATTDNPLIEASPRGEKPKKTTPPPSLISTRIVSRLEQSSPKATEPAPPADIWAQIRADFRLSVPANKRVEQELDWYRNNTDHLERIQARAQPYIYFILQEAKERDLPTELVLLPVVESAFRPFAYSPGRAAGLWQFIPSTGRLYGLKQTWWYDGRRDVVEATQAALDYLQALSKQFDGDWELALAAYNAGAGTVKKAIKKNRRRGKATDFWSLELPRETQSYVPRLLAVSQIIAEPDQHQIQLQPIPSQPYFASVDIESQLDLALAAEMAEISIEALYQLNPGFNRWATDPKGPHRLQLPLDKVALFEEKLAALAPEKRLRWKRYRIKNGDNLGAIARRHDTTVALLKQVNKLQGGRIRAGKHLLIPVSTKKLDHYALSAEQRKASVQNKKRTGTRITHVVEAGDTLWDIARRYKISFSRLASWNGIAPGDTLHLGQKLVIWQTKAKAAAKVQASADMLPVNLSIGPAENLSSLRYKVRKGDSLARIAQRFNVTVADLRKWNTLANKYLQPGQRLTLYVDVTEQTL